jgi:hypothetical protein
MNYQGNNTIKVMVWLMGMLGVVTVILKEKKKKKKK